MRNVVQTLPITFLVALSGGNFRDALRGGTCNAASLEVRAEGSVLTQASSAQADAGLVSESALDWIGFARAVVPDGRPIKDWERQDLDEFFWSRFD